MTIFFCILIILLVVSTILVRFSSFKINIKELELINKELKKYKIEISLNVFNKIKWLKITIDQNKINKLKNSGKTTILNKILDTKILKDYKNTGKTILKNRKSILKKINKIKIEKFNLQSKIGTEEADKTAYIVGIASSLLAIFLAKRTNNPKYIIEPVYIDKNYLYLSINCILSIKLVHIISISKELEGKEVYQKHGRTSNRRTYASSNA